MTRSSNQRIARRMGGAGLVVPDALVPRAKYDQLLAAYKNVVDFANRQTNLIRAQQADGSIVFQLDTSLPAGDQPLIPLMTHVGRVEELKQHQARVVTVAFALGELRLLVERVDLLTVHCNRTKLKDELAGYDERLIAMMQRVRKAAHEASYENELMVIIGRHAQLRIDALTIIKEDNGDTLRRVVAETSYDFKEQAQALIERLESGFTQGRTTEPQTRRIAELAYQAKYVEERTWGNVPEALFEMLRGGDALDQEILTNLEYDPDPEQTIKNAFHRYKNNDRNKDRTVAEIFSQRAIS